MTLGMDDDDYSVLRSALQKISDHSLSLAHNTLQDEKEARRAIASKRRYDLRRHSEQAQRDFEQVCETLGLSAEVDP